MKKSNFKPIYLQDAKRHIDWLYDKIKESSDTKDNLVLRNKESSFLSKVVSLLKKVF